MLKKIKTEIEGLELLIKPTIDNRNEFERNCRNRFRADLLLENAATIEKWQSTIGKEVYKLKESFSYSEVPNPDVLNKTEDEPILFTAELFEKFKLDAVNWWIHYHSKRLIENSITCNSSNKFSNLEFEWHLEETQNIIKFYKEKLLGKY